MNELIIWEDYEILKSKLIKLDNSNLETLNKDFEDLVEFNNIDKMNKYIKYIDSNNTTIGEYTDKKIVFYEDIKKQSEAYDTLMLDIANYYQSRKGFAKLELLFYNDFYNYDYNVKRKVFLGATGESIKGMEIMGIYGMDSYKVINYQNDFKMLIEDLKNKKHVF